MYGTANWRSNCPAVQKSVLWGHASQLRDASGHARGAIGAFLDITTMRKHAEDILRESETRFQNTADACPVMIWFGDREKRMVFINQQAARFTGVPTEELLDGGWTQVVHPDDLKYAREVYFDAVDRRAEYQLEYRIRRADGEYRNMLGTTRPRYFGREYAGQIGSVIDVTDVKRKQEETLARQNMESIGVLASGIAHDFNNLLGSVLAQSEAALANVEAGQRPDQQLTAIANIAARGAEIVRQLMAYAGQEDELPRLPPFRKRSWNCSNCSGSLRRRTRYLTRICRSFRPWRRIPRKFAKSF